MRDSYDARKTLTGSVKGGVASGSQNPRIIPDFLASRRPTRVVLTRIAQFVLKNPELEPVTGNRRRGTRRPPSGQPDRHHSVNLRIGDGCRAFEEVEVAALVGLRHVTRIEMSVAARVGDLARLP